MQTTFVTAFLDLLEDRSNDKSVEVCFQHFKRLAEANIPIHCFISKRYFTEYATQLPQEPTILYTTIELQDLYTYQELQGIEYRLPHIRTSHHDTLHFLVLMHAKIEFIQRSMDTNPFNTPQFAWIDFSICHVLKSWDSSKKWLEVLSQTALKQGLYFPGCWSLGTQRGSIFERINWRFCGGFFIGDTASLVTFSSLYRKTFATSVAAHHVLTWEVNFWHLLELLHGFQPTWFAADHNDSILRVPQIHFRVVASITTIPPRIETDCKAAIDSLLSQVDHLYLNVSSTYKRFGEFVTLPSYLTTEPYKSHVTVVVGPDYGPATKYKGATGNFPEGVWVFVGDDDQEYNTHVVKTMLQSIQELGVYQNHYQGICQKTSGGLIHGYVGNLIPACMLINIQEFPLPECAYFVDDQWMSIYCHKYKIPIFKTLLEEYNTIFKVLQGYHEKWGSHSLSGLHNRDQKVKELCNLFNVRFEKGTCMDL